MNYQQNNVQCVTNISQINKQFISIDGKRWKWDNIIDERNYILAHKHYFTFFFPWIMHYRFALFEFEYSFRSKLMSVDCFNLCSICVVDNATQIAFLFFIFVFF